jgi:hypothetical protein
MKSTRLGALGALCAVIAIGATAGVAPAASSPSATAAKAFASGTPSAIACGGFVDQRVTVTGQAGSSGNATNVMLVLDLSGSTGTPPSKLADLRRAATDTLAALDAADGTTDQSIAGNAAGVTYYRGSAATVSAALGSSYSALVAAINALPAPSGGSPHAAGINTAAAALAAAANGYARSLVLVSDGQAAGTELSDATAATTAAKGNGVRIVPIGVGTGADVSQANLQAWASSASSYQSGTPGPINRTQLVGDLGAAAAIPVNFTVTETLGANFAAGSSAVSTGAVTTSAGALQWTGTIAGSGTATLTYRATRNGNEVFAVQSEVVSTTGLTVTGGTPTVTPPAASTINVLPCGATPVSTTTCTGSACSASATVNGTQYNLAVGAPPAGTQVFMTALNAPSPPAGSCPGFVAHTTGLEFDIRPLSTDATMRVVIPRAQLGSTRWWQTDICIGTNLRFITAVESLSNLRPSSTLSGGGAIPGRWWGLLPSIPRFTLVPGLGLVRGPYITSRSVDSAGNAIVTFRVPYIANSSAYTTDGRPAYDPKLWG